MAPYGIKSIFVPSELLREEIKIGYGGGEGTDDIENEDAMIGGAVEEPDTEAAPSAEPAPSDEPVPSEEPAPAELFAPDAPAAPEEVPAAPEADQAAPEAVPASPEGPTTPEEVEPTIANAGEEDDAIIEPAVPGGGAGADVDAPLPPVPTTMLPHLSGGGYEDPSAFEQEGGGIFTGSSEVLNALRTLLVSANGYSMPDLFEDTLYEITLLKGHLDSIAQSLADISEKYVRSGQQQNNQHNNQHNNQRNGRPGGQFRDRQDRQDRPAAPAPEASDDEFGNE